MIIFFAQKGGNSIINKTDLSEELMRQIKDKRGELYMLANFNDLTSPIVLKCSQELDFLINKSFCKILEKRCQGGIR